MRQISVALAIALLCAIGAPAHAQNWLSKPVRLVSPFAPGGSSDIIARLIAGELSTRLHQQFYVENRDGAGGLIGSALVAHAAPDGETFLISSIGTHVTSPATSANPGYDAVADFTQVAMLGGPPTVIAVHPSLGVTTFAALLARLKSGVAMPYVSPGPGTIGHLIGEYLAEREGLKLSHVAYKGSGQALNDLAAGHVPLGSITFTAAAGQLRAGIIAPLAVSSAKRMPGFADVPTLVELGYPEIIVTTWFGIAAPAGLPAAITGRMNKAVAEALDATAVREHLAAEEFERSTMTPAELAGFIKSEIAKWAPLARRLTPASEPR
jgi:tripartite-type tricarboxylate transporter receptor subunit TctC